MLPSIDSPILDPLSELFSRLDTILDKAVRENDDWFLQSLTPRFCLSSTRSFLGGWVFKFLFLCEGIAWVA